MPAATILTDTGAAAIVSVLLSIVKPLVEAIPGLAPGSKLHDSALVLLNLLLCYGAQLLMVGAAHPVRTTDLIPAFVVAIVMISANTLGYKALTSYGSSVGSSTAQDAAAAGTPAAKDPVAAVPAVPPVTSIPPLNSAPVVGDAGASASA